MFTQAKRLLHEIDETIQTVRGASDELSGTIRILLTPGSSRIATRALYGFALQHPAIRIDIVVSPISVDIVKEGYDLCLRSGAGESDAYLKQPSIQSVKLTSATHHICAAPSYLRRYGRPQTPHDLGKHNCIIYLSQPSPRGWPFRDKGHRFWVQVDGSFTTNDPHIMYEAALAGIGIARIFSKMNQPDTNPRGLRYLFTDLIDEDRGVLAYYPQAKPLPKKIALLLVHLKSALEGS